MTGKDSTRYFTCFVCYGTGDLPFARRLVADLEQHGVSCWFWPEAHTPGEATQKEILDSRRAADKMIALCSVTSLLQNGVRIEIYDQIREDLDKLIPISLDDQWRHVNFPVTHAGMDLKPFLLLKNYADFANPSQYDSELERLLKALHRSDAAHEPGEESEPKGLSEVGIATSRVPRLVAAMGELLQLRGDTPSLLFVPQILDHFASILSLRYGFVSADELREPRVYAKVLERLQTGPLPTGLLVHLDEQGWDARTLTTYFSEIDNAIQQDDRTEAGVQRVVDRLSRLYTLAVGLVAEQRDSPSAEAMVEIMAELREDDRTECKSTMRYNLKTKKIDKEVEREVVRAIAGLANHRGGTLYLGVRDDLKIVGLKDDLATFRGSMDQFHRHFDQLVGEQIGIANYQIVQPKWLALEGEDVFVVKISAAPHPIFVGSDGSFYLRRGARTVNLNPRQFFEYYLAQGRWPSRSGTAAGNHEPALSR
jgi:hypothetical protein